MSFSNAARASGICKLFYMASGYFQQSYKCNYKQGKCTDLIKVYKRQEIYIVVVRKYYYSCRCLCSSNIIYMFHSQYLYKLHKERLSYATKHNFCNKDLLPQHQKPIKICQQCVMELVRYISQR